MASLALQMGTGSVLLGLAGLPCAAGAQMSLPAGLRAEADFSSSLGFSSSLDGERVADGTATPDLPEAPSPQSTGKVVSPGAQGQTATARAPQTKRIFGLIPNFRAVSTDEKLPPQTVKDKFTTTTQESFDYSSIVIPAVISAYSLGLNSDPEFGSGGVGYGRYLWHSVVDQTSENYWVGFILPVLTHEDTRYYTLGRGSNWKRTKYAVTRVLVTRSDSGKEVFNISEVGGAAIAAAVSNAYYPSPERTFGNTAKQIGTNVGVDGIALLFKEFWPDVNQALFHGTKDQPPPIK